MKSLITVLALLSAGSVYAADLAEQLQQCRSVEGELQRLTCYDKIDTATESFSANAVAPVAAVVAVSSVAVAPQTKADEAKPAPVADFGLEHKKVEEQIDAVDNLSLELKSVNTNRLGLLVFTFSNGQVWRQTSKDFFTVKEGSTYVVERGLFGAFYLNKVGTNRKIRVVREQ